MHNAGISYKFKHMDNIEVLEESKGRNRLAVWLEKKAGRPLKLSDKIIAGLLVVIFLFVFYVTLDANKYRAMVRVVDGEGRAGVNPTAEALDFGDLSRGMSAVRRVAVSNGTPVPMYVVAFRTGGVGELMKIERNYFTLKPHTEEKMEFTVYMPASSEVDKTYSGRVYLFKIPTFGI